MAPERSQPLALSRCDRTVIVENTPTSSRCLRPPRRQWFFRSDAPWCAGAAPFLAAAAKRVRNRHSARDLYVADLFLSAFHTCAELTIGLKDDLHMFYAVDSSPGRRRLLFRRGVCPRLQRNCCHFLTKLAHFWNGAAPGSAIPITNSRDPGVSPEEQCSQERSFSVRLPKGVCAALRLWAALRKLSRADWTG